jgi:hypothetical protein
MLFDIFHHDTSRYLILLFLILAFYQLPANFYVISSRVARRKNSILYYCYLVRKKRLEFESLKNNNNKNGN